MAKSDKRRRTGTAGPEKGTPANAPAAPPPRANAPRGDASRADAAWTDLLSEYGLLGVCGLGALQLALALAPVFGGVPAGYGFVDPYYLRLLVFLAALLLPPAALPDGRISAVARIAAGVAAGWTVLSLLVHSRFLTDSTLLAAMIPATLDWVCYALLFLLAMRLSSNRRTLLLVVGALLVGAAWATLSGVQEYGVERAAGRPEHRIMATFFAPNFAAGFFGLALPLAVALFLRARTLVALVSLGALAALTTGALAATGSRQGIAAAGVSLAAALLLALWCRVRLPWARVGALLVAMLAMAFVFRGPLTSRVAGPASAQAHSGQYRTETWKGSLAMARHYPVLGAGPGTFEYRYPPFSPVAKTNLAHSSYLQAAAEQGFPALLAAVLAIAAAFLAGLLPLRGPSNEDDLRLLRCALLGGLLTGVLRGFFDSEWSVLGNALPFWAVAGLVAGVSSPPATAVSLLPDRPLRGRLSGDMPQSEAGAASSASHPSPAAGEGTGVRARQAESPPLSGQVATRIAAAVGLLLTLLLLYPARALDDARTLERIDPAAARASAETAARAWPPSAEAKALLGRLSGDEEQLRLYREAATLEPSGLRRYQLARQYERAGDDAAAIQAFESALRAEPTSLQALRAQAEAQERTGDTAGAMRTWERLIELQEGPVGQIRAIPELVETHAVHAYAARGDAAWKRGERDAAVRDYAKATEMIEAYAGMPAIYAQMEVQQSGGGVTRRLGELKELYERLMERRIAAAPGETDTLRGQRLRTLLQLDNRLKETAALLGNSGAAGGNP